MPASNQLLAHAIQLYHSGDAPGAARILAGLLLQEPEQQATAWAWLRHIYPDDAACYSALEAAYSAHPRRAEIRQNLLRLRARLDLAQPAAGAEPAPKARAAHPARVSGGFLFSLGLLFVALALVVWDIGKQASTAAEIQQLVNERDTLQANFGAVSAQLADSNNRLRQLKYDYQVLSNQQADLQTRFDQLQSDYDSVETEYNALQRRYSGLNDQYLDLEQNSIRPPYIFISGRQVDMAFRRLDQSILHWKVGFDVLEANIERGQTSRNNMFNIFGKIESSYALDMPASGGGGFRVVDYRKFVDPGPFVQVMKSVYKQSPDEEAFLRETWNIMAQLTTYAFDPDRETPRYPLETLLAGGGDCEDTSILYASLIKAAGVDWKVSFLFMDSEHPDKLVEPNHLAVAVDTGSRVYVIETTSKNEMAPYSKPPDGWYLELP